MACLTCGSPNTINCDCRAKGLLGEEGVDYHTDGSGHNWPGPAPSGEYKPMDEMIIHVKGRFGGLPAKATCAECPLRRDSEPGRLGGWTPDMYVRGLVDYVDFACHMSKGFDAHNLASMRSCTGVANFRANIELPLPPGNAREAKEHAGPNKVDVFDSLIEFHNHHAGRK